MGGGTIDHVRHNGIFVIPSDFDVTIVGVGGIGAVAALCLAKMGVRWMTIYDDDVVGTENMSTQLHKLSDVGKAKVDTVAETLFMFSDEISMVGFAERVTSVTDLPGSMVICAVDSIAGRKEVFHAALKSPTARYWLDTRMSALEYQHFFLDLHDGPATFRYAQMLSALDDTNVPDVPCTEKATTFCSFMGAAHVGNVVKGIVTNDIKSHRLVQNIKSGFLMTVPL